LIENFGGWFFSIIGICGLLGNFINNELLIAKYIECLYFLKVDDEDANVLPDTLPS
jgi:hypothetical protein